MIRGRGCQIAVLGAILTVTAQGNARAADAKTQTVERGSTRVLDYEIKLDTVVKGIHKDLCWFHPRVGSVPGAGRNGRPAVVMTLQKHLHISDFYSGLSSLRTDDMGATWTPPAERPELAWRKADGDMVIGVCDCTPGWHAKSKKLLVIGCSVYYRKGHQVDELPSTTNYAVHDPKAGTWSAWRQIEMPDTKTFFMCRSACAQWLSEPDGTLLLPIYFGGRGVKAASVAVMRCSFDGKDIKYVEHGNVMTLGVDRGLCEPSITFFQDRYYLTIRNDRKGYVTVSDDGLHFAPIKPWTFDDGSDLGSYNTQQHWVTHSDGLFLTYTRRGANNDHMFRHRAPLFIGKVDPEKLCVIRKGERVLIPERGASLGNFGAIAIDERETWVTVSEGMFWPKLFKRGAEGAVFVARVIWSKPNRLLSRLR